MQQDHLAFANENLMTIERILNDETPIETPEVFYVGIDLGTADIQTVVIDGSGVPIAAFLDWADVVRDGVVVDYFGACQIVQKQIAKVTQKLGIEVTEAITSYPPGTDPRISINVVESTGVLVTEVIDEPSSVGALLHVESGVVVDVGGGTTGTAIIENRALVLSLDEPSGGRHMTLTIAGGMKVSIEEAELLKREGENDRIIATMVAPVVEKMAMIVTDHIKGYSPKTLYLTGGGTLIGGFLEIFQNAFPQLTIVKLSRALYLTPLAIASYALTENRNK